MKTLHLIIKNDGNYWPENADDLIILREWVDCEKIICACFHTLANLKDLTAYHSERELRIDTDAENCPSCDQVRGFKQ